MGAGASSPISGIFRNFQGTSRNSLHLVDFSSLFMPIPSHGVSSYSALPSADLFPNWGMLQIHLDPLFLKIWLKIILYNNQVRHKLKIGTYLILELHIRLVSGLSTVLPYCLPVFLFCPLWESHAFLASIPVSFFPSVTLLSSKEQQLFFPTAKMEAKGQWNNTFKML